MPVNRARFVQLVIQTSSETQGTGRERFWAMSKETQRSSGRHRLDRDEAAADALELARQMAPGPERNKALKLAGALRRSADERGVVFAKRGRPRKS
jgi:hypothetical protein